MENPATWGRAEHVVLDALANYERARREGRAGLSRVRVVTDALRREGLLVEDEDADEEDRLPPS